ncbi:hypothetical protein SEVIR_5G045701v4 [Setaria viridis]|uniref:Uncharacterized protein n=1 Tax=Setaria viridis TaxID=4556 RepID=A0A4U6UES5_SETVI|nr:hypothetical protein SEVIR_5G045701v2 [Setaria viridis]
MADEPAAAAAGAAHDYPTIDPTSFDVVLFGTGLPESVLAAACAAAGKTVLHVDPNPFYGSHYTSVPLPSLASFLPRPFPVLLDRGRGRRLRFAHRRRSPPPQRVLGGRDLRGRPRAGEVVHRRPRGAPGAVLHRRGRGPPTALGGQPPCGVQEHFLWMRKRSIL